MAKANAPGRDGTEAFEDVGHSDEARDMLPKMLVGSFKGEVSTAAAVCGIRPQRLYAIRRTSGYCRAWKPEPWPPDISSPRYDGVLDRSDFAGILDLRARVSAGHVYHFVSHLLQYAEHMLTSQTGSVKRSTVSSTATGQQQPVAKT